VTIVQKKSPFQILNTQTSNPGSAPGWRPSKTAKETTNFLGCLKNPPWSSIYLAVNKHRQDKIIFLGSSNLAAKKKSWRQGNSVLV
jgi:hypothetical protein